MSNKEKNIQIINDIAENCSLENWDGYCAKPIENKIIEKAVEIISEIPEEFQPGFIAPLTYNAIQIEYENDNYYLEFEIYKNHIEGYISMSNFNDENILAFTTSDILEYIKKYYKT